MKGLTTRIRGTGRGAIRLLVPAVMAALLLLGTAVPAKAVTTVYQAGYPGRMLTSPVVYCELRDWGSNVSPRFTRAIGGGGDATIGRSYAPGYANALQTLYVRHTAQWWNQNSRSWVNYDSSGWKSEFLGIVTADFGQPGSSFHIFTGGYSWRLVTEYQWFAGNKWLGSVTNVYNVPDYYVQVNTGQSLRPTLGTSSGGDYCYIP